MIDWVMVMGIAGGMALLWNSKRRWKENENRLREVGKLREFVFWCNWASFLLIIGLPVGIFGLLSDKLFLQDWNPVACVLLILFGSTQPYFWTFFRSQSKRIKKEIKDPKH